jgi:hypothetical protein
LALLDGGWSCQEVAAALLLNDFEQRGIEGLTSFDVGGSASFFERRARRRIESIRRARRCRARRARSDPNAGRETWDATLYAGLKLWGAEL